MLDRMDALRQAPAAADVVVTGILTRLTDLPGVARVGIALNEGAGRRLQFTSSDRIGETLAWCLIDAFDDVPLTSVARSGDPVVGTLDALATRFPAFVSHQATTTRAVIAVPLNDDRMILGGIIAFLHDETALPRIASAVTAEAAEAARLLTRTARSAVTPAGTGPDDTTAADGATDASRSFRVEDAAQVAAARRRLRAVLNEHGIDGDATDDAAMCLSELLTNAVMHTGAPAHVRIDLDADLLHVTIRDEGNDFVRGPSRVDSDDALRVYGRGLQIVDALSTRWGHRQERDGTTVWFELALSRP